MGFERLVMGLRALELAFALIVVGLAGNFIATGGDPTNKDADASTRHRFIYTIIVACIASILALVWLFPFTANFTQWPSDIVISILWWAAFGLLVNVSENLCHDAVTLSTALRLWALANMYEITGPAFGMPCLLQLEMRFIQGSGGILLPVCPALACVSGNRRIFESPSWEPACRG